MPKVADRPVNRLREATALLDSPQISALFDKVRATVNTSPEPPPEETPDEPQAVAPPRAGIATTGGPRFAAAAIGLVILATAWIYGPAHPPTFRLTLPGGARADAVIAGDTHLYNGDFFAN